MTARDGMSLVEFLLETVATVPADQCLTMIRALDTMRDALLEKYQTTPQWVDCGRCRACKRRYEVSMTPRRERSCGVPDECPLCWNALREDGVFSVYTDVVRYPVDTEN